MTLTYTLLHCVRHTRQWFYSNIIIWQFLTNSTPICNYEMTASPINASSVNSVALSFSIFMRSAILRLLLSSFPCMLLFLHGKIEGTASGFLCFFNGSVPKLLINPYFFYSDWNRKLDLLSMCSVRYKFIRQDSICIIWAFMEWNFIYTCNINKEHNMIPLRRCLPIFIFLIVIFLHQLNQRLKMKKKNQSMYNPL